MATKYDQDAKAKAVRLGMSAETLRKWVRRAAIDDGHAAGVSTAESRKLPRGVDLGPGFLQLDLLAGLAWAARSHRQRFQRALLGGAADPPDRAAVDPPLLGGLTLGVLLG
jgi:hypothetical protein